MPKTLVPGVYAPTLVFYLDNKDETIDKDTVQKHAIRLAEAGVAGIVTNGSIGEGVCLSLEEQYQVTKLTRDALDSEGFSHLPIIVGACDQSVQGTLRLCEDAKHAGGDAVLLVVPSHFRWAMTPETIEKYFRGVADESPLPLIIYNCPGSAGGLDLDSDQLISLSQHPNIVGTEFTCGSVGKLARVAEATSPVSELFTSTAKPYFAFAGVADFISSSVDVGATGAIVATANVFPRACVNVYKLAIEGKRVEAMKAQQQLAKADWELIKRAIPGFKALLSRWFAYGGIPRMPMPPLSEEETDELAREVAWMVEIEDELEDFGVRSG